MLVTPPECIGDGTDDDLIELFVVNVVLCEMIVDTEQPACLNVSIVKNGCEGRSRLIKMVWE